MTMDSMYVIETGFNYRSMSTYKLPDGIHNGYGCHD